MARNNELGAVRRSQVITTYGPGALVDFRAGAGGGAPISVVAAGLDVWDERAKPAGMGNPQTIHEPRLQRQLGVAGFRLPPVVPDATRRRGESATPHLIGVRFPSWLQCPKCFRLKPEGRWAANPGDPTRTCTHHGTDRVYVVPVGFVVSCALGHLAEFPWDFWVRHTQGCIGSDLTLQNQGASGLAGLILRCAGCGASRSMEGCFGSEALSGLSCGGLRPWLPGGGKETCAEQKVRALQRGASNLYFAATVSALDIPPWSDRIQKEIGQWWDPLVTARADERTRLIEIFKLDVMLGLSADDILARVNERIDLIARSGNESLRWEEYLQFTADTAASIEDSTEFEIVPRDVPPELGHWLSRVIEAKRLREVRALRGFTRIDPPGDSNDEAEERRLCKLSLERKNWLPAIEVKGEGLFIEFSREAIEEWAARAELIRERVARMSRALGFVTLPDQQVTPAFVLLHSFAHALMRELSVSSGYGSSALRERLYVGEGPRQMCGVLIYTATSDADGTLGGLSRQARPEAVLNAISGALSEAKWCASDPLCIHANRRLLDAQNAAACHACMFVSETSCEHFNRFLDRACLVGTTEQPDLGFFHGFGG